MRFQTTAPDGIPWWKRLYDLFHDQEYGTIVPYDKVTEVVGIDLREQRSPIYRAIQELEEHAQRTLVAVPNQGYRVAQPADHAHLAHRRRRLAGRQMGKAVSVAMATNRALVTTEQIRKIDEFANWAVAVQNILVVHNTQLGKHEERLAAIEKKLDTEAVPPHMAEP
jgi:hypothetical protein